MNKKNILIILAILTLTSIVILFVLSNKNKQTLQITPPKPNIPNYLSGKLPIEVVVKNEDFIFPSELPTLRISRRTINKEITLSFARKLGFGEDIKEFEGVNEGVKYYINTDKYFFIATPKTSTIKYGLSSSEIPVAVRKNIQDPEFVDIATKFLTDNGFYSANQLKTLPLKYYKTKQGPEEGLEESDRNSADIFQVGFVFNSNEYEILTEKSATNQIYIQILPDGTIYNSEILLITDIQKSISTYPLKTYDDLINNLDEAKLINLHGDYIAPSDLTIQDILSLKIEKIKIAYLLESGKEDSLKPIYLLEGPVKIINSSANYATVYLPAFK